MARGVEILMGSKKSPMDQAARLFPADLSLDDLSADTWRLGAGKTIHTRCTRNLGMVINAKSWIIADGLNLRLGKIPLLTRCWF